MNHTQYTEKAIPLISVDSNTGKYFLTNEAATFIQSIPGPIGVVSVAGLYRTGKSYLLNRMLLNRSSGFGVGPTINPCTKGLWCWGTPIKGTSTEGQSVNIIVIDTEGIGALDEDQTHDTRIFTLAILLSSCFIYNSVGSIDENAIQNLSLVVNLTKHIQINTSSKHSQEDPDRIATYFPTFYWVVRDFSLQLVDSEGTSMTSKEYLQKALAPQKGFSDDTEQKNRIRRLLTTYFKERECFTLIRPLVDQPKLQDLDKLDFDQLRPDFVDQILNFRKRVINKIKVKTLNDKKLNGEMYLSMVNSYVGAINDGAVPNIENAWNYMCREQCSKVLSQAYEAFERQLHNYKYPCSDEEFQTACESSSEVAYQTFKSRSFGESSQEYWKQLNKKMKNKIRALKSQNQKQAKPIIHQYFVKNFNGIEKKLKMGDFKSYSQFQKEMDAQYNNFVENGPKVMNAKAYYLQYIKKVLPQGAQFFFKTLKNQYEKLKAISQEKEKNYQLQLQTLKSCSEKDSQAHSDKICTLDRQKVQMQLSIDHFKETLQKMSKESKSEEDRLQKIISAKQSDLDKLKKSLESNVGELSSKHQEISKKLLTQERQWEKEKAILELKVKQLTATVEQLQKKEKTLDSSLNMSKNQMNLQLKEATNKYQKKIGQSNLQIIELRDQNNDLAEELKSVKEELESKSDKFQKKEKKYKEDLMSKTKELQKVRQEYELEKNKIQNQHEIHTQGIGREHRELTEAVKKQQSIIKALNESLKSQKIAYEKDLAILTQKISFLQENLRDSKQQLIQTKQSYEATIATLEGVNGEANQEQENQRIADLKNTHQRQLRNIQTQSENVKKKMEFDIDTLTKAKNQIQLKFTLLTEAVNNTKYQSDDKIIKMQEQIQILTNELKNMERSKNTMLMEKEVFYENKIKQMELEVEEVKDKAISEQKDSHSKSEQAITQLKNYYQFQKEKLESKLTSERQRNQKKFGNIIEEYEKRLKEEIQTLQEQNQQLQQDRVNMETTFQNTISQLQHQSDLKSKDLQNLTRILSDLKENFNKKQTEYNQKLDLLVQTSRAQKDAHYQKTQALQSENNKKDKQILSLTHLRDQLSTNLLNRESKTAELQSQLSQSKQNYERIIEDWKKKYNSLSHEYLQKKINNEKTIALASQENQFYAKKVQDLEKQYETVVLSYEQKIKSLKEESSSETKINLEKIGNEKMLVEQKYEKLKKSSRENETTLQRQITQLTKEKAVDNQKMLNMDQKLRQIEVKRASESSSYQIEIGRIKQAFYKQKKQIQDQLAEQKRLYQESDNQRIQIMNKYEKDTLLMQHKINHLEDVKDTLKRQTSQKVKTLESAVESLQKNRMNQKNSAETTHTEQILKVQSNFRSQIMEISENLSKKTHEAEAATKRYQLQLKVLNEKLALEIQAKNNIQQSSQKKITQLMEIQKKLSADIQRMKIQRDQKGMEYHKNIESEKEVLKNKVRDTEQRYKQMEKQKQHLYFQREKEQAKWKFEKENIDQKMQELKDKISKYEREVSKLQRENQKLKAEKKNAKAHSFINNNKWNNTFIEEKKNNINKEEEDNKENILG